MMRRVSLTRVSWYRFMVAIAPCVRGVRDTNVARVRFSIRCGVVVVL
jgi:hypothetical protein